MTPILAIRGGSNRAIQALMGTFASDLSGRGVRVAGLVEIGDEASDPTRARDRLRDFASGRSFAIHQDLGPGSTACQLDGSGVTEACELVRRQILEGCDLAVLSKFGKLEACRSGLVAAFAAAVETGTPVLTAVAPSFAQSWSLFSGSLATYAPPCRERLEAWWGAVHGPAPRHRGGSPKAAATEHRTNSEQSLRDGGVRRRSSAARACDTASWT